MQIKGKHLQEYWQEGIPRKDEGIFIRKPYEVRSIFYLLFFFLIPGHFAEGMTIKVVDYFTGEPIRGAIVTSNHGSIASDDPEKFIIPPLGSKLRVRAHGYKIA